MGTDIHMLAELRHEGREDDEYWQPIVVPEWLTDRNYQFFAQLAGVRGSYETMAGNPIPARDHRPDLSEFEKPISKTVLNWLLDSQCSDVTAIIGSPGYHDFGWVTLEELRCYRWHSGAERIAGPLIEFLEGFVSQWPWNIEVRLWYGFDS